MLLDPKDTSICTTNIPGKMIYFLKKNVELGNNFDYFRLLNGQEEKDKDAFLETKAPLKAFEAKMEGYANLNEEICEIRNSTMLNQYELDCRDFNNDMSQRCLNLRSSLINWQVDMNKTWNRQICNQFDEMATKLGEIPGMKAVFFFIF